MRTLKQNELKGIEGGAVAIAWANVQTFRKFQALANVTGDNRILAIAINNFQSPSADYANLYKAVKRMVGPVQAS